MASAEVGAYVFLAGYGLVLWGAIRVFGFRRVMWAIFGVLLLGIAVAFKTLGAVVSPRR